jgi:uncharacterized Ntn-hydrolase superfamily protein
MTYSIVARDPETGALGVAVQTCMFAVGSVVPPTWETVVRSFAAKGLMALPEDVTIDSLLA